MILELLYKSEYCCIIRKTQLIQFTDRQKLTEKVTWAIYRPGRKA